MHTQNGIVYASHSSDARVSPLVVRSFSHFLCHTSKGTFATCLSYHQRLASVCFLILITLQHTVYQIPKWTPVIFTPTLLQSMLIHKENIVLEARIQVWLEPQMDHDVVVMAIDVGIDTVEALEKLADGGGEVLGEGDADAGGEGGFIVD